MSNYFEDKSFISAIEHNIISAINDSPDFLSKITSSNKLDLNKSITRKEWMLECCDRVLDFYPKEISKINERIKRFEEVRNFWLNK